MALLNIKERNNLNIITAESYETLSKMASQFIIDEVNSKPNATIGMATGGTPLQMYQLLQEDYKQNGTSYCNVTTFNLDEYVGLAKDNPNSYYQYMKKHLFNHIDIEQNNVFIPNGESKDLVEECNLYERYLLEKGPIDIQILGLGSNGHIGFNEPGTPFSSKTHVVELTDSTRKANARYFDNLDQVPTHAITMGIDTIMRAKKILLLVSGKNKSNAYEQLLHGKISEQFPVSVLRNHPSVHIIADMSSLESVTIRV
ncbi:glucosamine-6-phosphate deaminase [Sutcliffiella cohnii]|uniref:Glucosamine-6-phosphate deaminase n=1 Tax=Sutcliffiella cohnii TaxID=33932 RepID=A0A223KQ41_9BACI|nr:glucosamine-6-phosphate deaminase [Sutcliffiella cohnii]